MEKPVGMRMKELKQNIINNITVSELRCELVEQIITRVHDRVIQICHDIEEKEQAQYEQALLEQAEKEVVQLETKNTKTNTNGGKKND